MLSMPRISIRGMLAALPHVLKRDLRETQCKVYITDALKAIAENTARIVGGSAPTQRYAEMLDKKRDNRTGEQIAADIITRAGLVVKQ